MSKRASLALRKLFFVALQNPEQIRGNSGIWKPQRKRALQFEYFPVVSSNFFMYPLPLVKIMEQRIFIDNLTEFYH